MSRQTVPCLICGSEEHTSSSCKRPVPHPQMQYLGVTPPKPCASADQARAAAEQGADRAQTAGLV